MPMPQEYFHASRDFDAFMEDVMAALDHTTRHQSFHTVLGVFDAFRRHLTPAQGVLFANALPPVLRALFVDGWEPDDAPPPFPDEAGLEEQVQAFRRDHNFSPPGSFGRVVRVVRAHVDRRDFERTLARLPEAAAKPWRIDDA